MTPAAPARAPSGRRPLPPRTAGNARGAIGAGESAVAEAAVPTGIFLRATDRLSPTRRGRSATDGPELALAATTVVSALSVDRLIDHDLSAGVVLPVLASVLVGYVLCALADRRGAVPGLASLAGTVGAVLVTVWAVVPGATRLGLPTLTTWRVALHDLHVAHLVTSARHTPVPAIPGVVLLAALASGAVAAATRALWAVEHRRPAPRVLLPLVPTLAMFCYSGPLSARIDRVPATLGYLAAALAFVALADAAGARFHLDPGSPRRPVPLLGPALTVGLTLGTVALAGVFLSSTVPAAFPWWRATATGSGPGGGAGAVGSGAGTGSGAGNGPTGLSLVDNLLGTELDDSDTKMFSARVPVPTYWQVATLTVWDPADDSWQPDPSLALALGERPTAGAPRAGILAPADITLGPFTAQVTMQHFRTSLLPVPPDTLLTGRLSTTAVGAGDFLLASPTRPGERYTVTAYLPAEPDPSGTDPRVAVDDADPGLQPYLAVHGVAPEVAALARQIVSGAPNPLRKVIDLLAFFRSGNFTYSLHPPVLSGTDPLLAFLTVTRTGYCQQFAGAYAVMARLVGVPARVAVGFAPGTPTAAGTVEITGKDAHAWPEVYLGRHLGWVSVEPTPGGPGSAGTYGVYRVDKSTPVDPDATKDTLGNQPRVNRPRSKLPPDTTTPPVEHVPPPVPHANRGPAVLVAAAVVVVLLAGGALVLARRRRRQRPDLALDPDARVVAALGTADRVLERAGLGRPPWETPAAHAAVLKGVLDAHPLSAWRDRADGDSRPEPPAAVTTSGGGLPDDEEMVTLLSWAFDSYEELADLVDRACYAPVPPSAPDASRAEKAAHWVAVALGTRPRRVVAHRIVRDGVARAGRAGVDAWSDLADAVTTLEDLGDAPSPGRGGAGPLTARR